MNDLMQLTNKIVSKLILKKWHPALSWATNKLSHFGTQRNGHGEAPLKL
jgi:hypothetical protein